MLPSGYKTAKQSSFGSDSESVVFGEVFSKNVLAAYSLAGVSFSDDGRA